MPSLSLRQLQLATHLWQSTSQSEQVVLHSKEKCCVSGDAQRSSKVVLCGKRLVEAPPPPRPPIPCCCLLCPFHQLSSRRKRYTPRCAFRNSMKNRLDVECQKQPRSVPRGNMKTGWSMGDTVAYSSLTRPRIDGFCCVCVCPCVSIDGKIVMSSVPFAANVNRTLSCGKV